MWWLFCYYDYVWPLMALQQTWETLKIGQVISQFMLLGIIPGTDFCLTFTEIVVSGWIIFFILVSLSLYLRGQIIINHLNPYRFCSSQTVYKLIAYN